MIVYDTAVTTYRWGDGPRPVLVVHGWSSRASRFAGLIEALRAQGRTVISFDAPGHGESEGRASTIRDYRAIIGRLHAEHGDFSAVVAHSFGVLAAFSMLHDGMGADRVVGIGGVADFGYLVERFRAGLTGRRSGARPAHACGTPAFPRRPRHLAASRRPPSLRGHAGTHPARPRHGRRRDRSRPVPRDRRRLRPASPSDRDHRSRPWPYPRGPRCHRERGRVRRLGGRACAFACPSRRTPRVRDALRRTS
ncbi:alpha/beta hydrolase [Streptomyces avidinii]